MPVSAPLPTYTVQARISVRSILRHNDGLEVLLPPVLGFWLHRQLDRVKLTRLCVPAVVAVEADHVQELTLLMSDTTDSYSIVFDSLLSVRLDGNSFTNIEIFENLLEKSQGYVKLSLFWHFSIALDENLIFKTNTLT